jgi:hypothetical protein
MEELSLVSAVRNCFISEKHIMTLNLVLMNEAAAIGS